MTVLENVVSISVYAAVIFCCIMLFKQFGKNKISPVLQFVLWFVLIARLVIPFTADSGFRLMTVPAGQQAPEAVQSEPAETKQESAATTGPIQAGQNDGAADGAVLQEQQQPSQTTGKEATTQQSASQQISTEEQETSKPVLGTGQLILVIWLAGALVIGIGMQALRTGMNRGIRKGAVLPDKRIDDIFKSCRQELGIKGNIRLRLCSILSTPALTVAFRPELLLPLDLFSEDENILRYAILHELTHWKRKDHWVRILMNAIKIIWWFHPVVWLADRQIMMDMESACDSMVVRDMHSEEKKCYANTILSMFAKTDHPGYVLGMALRTDKKVVEKRIRGIYMKQKTKRSVKLAAILLCAVMAVACFTTACTPAKAEDTETPEMVEAASASSAGASATEMPAEHITKTLDTENEGIKINIDADVIRPTNSTIPVRGYETREFTQQDVDNAIKAIMGDKEIYAPIRTKADIQKEIDEMEPAGQGTIDGLREELETAPETAEKRPANTTLTHKEAVGEDIGDGELQHSFNMTWDEVTVWAGDMDSPDTLSIRANSNLGDSGLWYTGGGRSYYDAQAPTTLWNSVQAGQGEEARGMDLTRVQAEEQAVKIAQALDPQMKLVLTELVPIVDNLPFDEEEYDADPEAYAQKQNEWRAQSDEQAKTAPQIYRFTFEREVDGVPVTYTNSFDYTYTDGTPNIVGEDGHRVAYEQMQIMLDNDGIVKMNWTSPGKAGEAGEKITPVSVDEAIGIMQKNILKMDMLLSEPADELKGFGVLTGSADINRITLGYARVMNDDGSFSIVPAWDFFGDFHISRNGEDMGTSNNYATNDPSNSLITINAKDGSLILREGIPFYWINNGWTDGQQELRNDAVTGTASVSKTSVQAGEKVRFTFILSNSSGEDIENCTLFAPPLQNGERLGDTFSIVSGNRKTVTWTYEPTESITVKPTFRYTLDGEERELSLAELNIKVEGSAAPTPTPSAGETPQTTSTPMPQPAPTPTPEPWPVPTPTPAPSQQES